MTSWNKTLIRLNVYLKRMTMPKKDMECFIVKFVESNGKKTEYALKAYEVRHLNLTSVLSMLWFLIFPSTFPTVS